MPETPTAQERLVAHYEEKYAASRSEVTPVSIDRPPSNRFEMAARIVSSNPGGRYLEIGAGSGNVALTVVEKYEEMILTELALNRARMLQELFRPYPSVHVKTHNVEAEELEYPDGHFNTILMVAVVEHLIDPIGVIRKLHRKLAPGGRLILDTPNIAKWTRRIKLAAGYFPSTASLDEGFVNYDRITPTDLLDEGHLHYFTFRSLSRLCVERVGFRRVERHGYGVPVLSQILPTLFSEVCIVAYK